MKKIVLDNIELNIDLIKTQLFYLDKEEFLCECKDCINYTLHFKQINESLNGLDKEIGIDITKDVGIGMDELMPNDMKEFHIYEVPYYVYGRAYFCGNKLTEDSDYNIKYKVDETLELRFQNNDYGQSEFGSEEFFVIWFEFKTPLVTYDDIVKEN